MVRWASLPGAPANTGSPLTGTPNASERNFDDAINEAINGIDLTSMKASSISHLAVPSKTGGNVPKVILPVSKSRDTTQKDVEGFLPTCEQYANLCRQYQIVLSTLPEYLSASMK
jgi:hypothetical protein